MSLKLNDATDPQPSSGIGKAIFKPCVGFLLRPSSGSAFQPIEPAPQRAATQPFSSDSQLLRIIDRDDDDGGGAVIESNDDDVNEDTTVVVVAQSPADNAKDKQ